MICSSELTVLQVVGLAGSPRRGGNTETLLDRFLAGAASAGDFQTWTLAGKGGEVVLAVSFIGDGVTQDAQLDLAVPAGYRVVSNTTKAAGSVCASFASESKIRVVPPSGAGHDLLSIDCHFHWMRRSRA